MQNQEQLQLINTIYHINQEPSKAGQGTASIL